MRLFITLLLLPLSLLYGLVMLLRNAMYDFGVFKSYRAPVPTLIVGNLSLGGTGKTPHVEYFINLLSEHYKIAVLSRGYGRKTKGFLKVSTNSHASEVGDEPLQIHIKYPNIPFAVCEKRASGIQELIKQHPEIELIILDDAMQHRRITGSLVVMLSLFDEPFFKDWVVPSGRLREFAFFGKQRADICIYTKCARVSDEQKKRYQRKFSNRKPAFFSRYRYGDWVLFSQKSPEQPIEHVLLVTGVANADKLVEHLKKNYHVTHINFKDHHNFTEEDVAEIHRKMTNFEPATTAVVCTEKDAVKFWELNGVSQNHEVPWFYIPITAVVDEEEKLQEQIISYVTNYSGGRRLHTQ